MRRTFLFAAALLAAAPAIAAPVAETEPNDSFATAQLIPGSSFTLGVDPDIGDMTMNTSTTIPNASIQAFAEKGGFDFFTFDVAAAGSRGIFDIDYGFRDPIESNFDSQIALYDAAFSLLASNDDAPSSFGASGSIFEVGDSYLEFIFATAGTYYLQVGSFGSAGPRPFVISGGDVGDYELQISLTAPVPAPPALALFGLGLAALAAVRRRRASLRPSATKACEETVTVSLAP